MVTCVTKKRRGRGIVKMEGFICFIGKNKVENGLFFKAIPKR